MESPIGLLKKIESFKTEEEYRESPAMSYSIFKDIYDNPEILLSPREEKKDEWFVFGRVTDSLLTDTTEIFENKFVINEGTTPSEQYKLISDYIIEKEYDVNNLTDDQVLECFDAAGSKVNWSVTTKNQKILENCTGYIDFISKNKNKTIISKDLFNEANNIANLLLTHKWTRILFMSEVEQVACNIEIYYQYKIKYIFKDIMFKSMMDILVVDHNLKRIYPYDIKTGTNSPRSFLKNAVYRYKYLYQAALYKEGIKAFIDRPEFNGYEVDDFRFVYVSRIKPLYPVILRISDIMHYSFMNMGLLGRYYLPSVEEVILALKHYINKIEMGETKLLPYDLDLQEGEYELEEDLYNTMMYNY